MTAQDFCKMILKITNSDFSRTLNDQKNLSPANARIASHVLGTKFEVWVFAGYGKQRQAAWKRFQAQHRKRYEKKKGETDV